jgi:hypothetical protein
MLGRLITIETYNNAMQASLAKNYLESAGVRCVLADEVAVTSGFSGLTNAMGGIKLQVAEEDMDRACDLLDEIEHHRSSAEPKPETNPAPPEAADAVPPEPKPGDDDEPDEPPLNAREDNAERARRAVLVGCMLIPLQLYATWVLLDVWQSDLPIRPAIQRKLYWTIALHLPMLLVTLLVMYLTTRGMINMGRIGFRI